MSFPRYPKYKDSGVEWLGKVPEDWDVMRLRRLASAKSGIDEKSEDGEIPLYGANGVIGFSRSVSCPDGALLVGRVGSAGSLTLASGPCAVSDNALVISLLDETHRRFLFYVLSQLDLSVDISNTAQPLLTASTLLSKRVTIPRDDSTRVAIAAFLDRETAKIDALIAEQQRLIELLQEKRQAVISHAVTKGLNPDAPMKESGIEWLGEVPGHWGVTRISRYATVGNGSTPSRDNQDYWRDGDIPWLSSGEVNQLHVTAASEFVTAQAIEECSLTVLPKGTVLVGMVGQGKTRGLSALLRIEAAINQNLAGIVTTSRLKPEYLHFVFQAMYEYLREYGRGGNQAALNCEILSAAIIPLPPYDEQEAVCVHLANACDQQDSLLTATHRTISLLQERRSALISAAVTGQIDVRGFAGAEAA